MRVVGVGQCSWDYLAEVASFPTPDTKMEVESWTEQGGGPVATALVALARLGVSCDFHGVTGSDEEGEKIRRSLSAEGIGIAGLAVRKNATSQKAFIAIDKRSGKRTIFWIRPAGGALLPAELQPGFLDRCDFLLLDGLMPEVSRHAADQARKRGIPVMLDAGRVRPGILELAARCDYLVTAEQFALDLGWDDRIENFQALAARLGARVTTVTLGERGSITCSRGKVMAVPAFRVPIVDTTGAGDVFHGGYIFGLLRAMGLLDTIRFASAMAALKCTMVGGRSGIPDLAETLRFLTEQGVEVQI